MNELINQSEADEARAMMQPGDYGYWEEAKTVERYVTLRFYRHPKTNLVTPMVALRADEIEIERNGIKRTYNNPNNARYNRISKIIREHSIPLDTDLLHFTEITFQADKEQLQLRKVICNDYSN